MTVRRGMRGFVAAIGGVTIVELLVALTLLSFILAGILALTRSTLRFTVFSSQISSQTEVAAAAESYLTDVLRSAKASTIDVQVERSDGTTLNCVYNTLSTAPAEERRCLGVYVPTVDGDGDIENYDFVVLSIERIGNLYAAEGVDRGWNGTDTLAVLEYRVPSLCASPCSVPPVAADGATVDIPAPPGLILAGLSPLDGATPPQPVDFFNFDGDSTIQLRLVSQARTREGQVFVVDREPLPLFVARRR